MGMLHYTAMCNKPNVCMTKVTVGARLARQGGEQGDHGSGRINVAVDRRTEREVRITTPVTHEEMAQRIGASRETVTLVLSELKKKDLIKLEGSTLVITNRTALEAMA
jgi:CRP-like cAMP-binding protein